jgi:hypothetical protein
MILIELEICMIYSTSGFLVVMLLVCTSAVGANAKPAYSSAELKSLLASFEKEILSEWEILHYKSENLYIGSRPRRLDISDGYCVRDVIRLSRNHRGKLEPLSRQLAYVGSTEDPSVFTTYALLEGRRSCEVLEQNAFVRISSFDGLAPGDQFLELIKNLISKRWETAPLAFPISFDDSIAQRCLASSQHLNLLEAMEFQSEGAGFAFRVRVGECLMEQRLHFIYLDVSMSLANKVESIIASSISKAEFDCTSLNCLSVE